jgi:hypothetical protein
MVERLRGDAERAHRQAADATNRFRDMERQFEQARQLADGARRLVIELEGSSRMQHGA